MPNASHAASSARRLVSLDALRGIAVLLVIGNHLRVISESRPENLWWLTGGWLGVDLFFALSGFFIGTILLRDYVERQFIAYRAFWWRRVRRLFPALLLFLAVWTLLAWTPTRVGSVLAAPIPGTDFPAGQITAAAWGVTLTGFQNGWILQGMPYPDVFRHLWSLAIEWQFYLLAPFVLTGLFAIAVRRYSSRTLALALLAVMIVVAGVVHAVMTLQDGAQAGYVSLLGRVPALLSGVAVAVAVTDSPRLAGRPIMVPSRVRAGLLIAVGALLLLAWGSADQNSAHVIAFVVPVAGVLAGALVWLAVMAQWRGRSARALAWFGQRSYSAYLYNFPIVVLASVLVTTAPVWLVVAGVFLATWVAAAASWHLAERPTFGGIGRQ